MTTSYFPLIPTRRAAPVFNFILDGSSYQCTVRWNLYGQRFNLMCYDEEGVLVFAQPIVASPGTWKLASLAWDAASLRAYVQTTSPHKMTVGATVNITVAGTNPDGYNGAFDVNVTSPTEFNYPLNADPGLIIKLGTAGFIISLCKGYFNSTIVFRNGQFEISP